LHQSSNFIKLFEFGTIIVIIITSLLSKKGFFMICPKCGADIPEGSIKCPICGHEISGNPANPSRSQFWFLSLKIAMTIGAILSLFEIYFWAANKNYSMPLLATGLGLLIVGYILMRVFNLNYEKTQK